MKDMDLPWNRMFDEGWKYNKYVFKDDRVIIDFFYIIDF